MTTYQTRQVLGACYKGRRAALDIARTHLVFLEPVMNPHLHVLQDVEQKTGCRQPVDNLADSGSDPEGNDKRPTCPTCARKWDKLQKGQAQ